MDNAAIDNLARAFVTTAASRRSLIAGLALSPFTRRFDGAAAKKKGRCKKKKRCGKGCCNPSRCFAKSVNPDGGEVERVGCCPDGSLCRSEVAGYPDQCCYADETCDPQLAITRPTLYTICCRRCGSECLALDYVCVDGSPQELHTARLPRYRR